jgi:2-dehydropantoate 2-reductase
MTPVSNGVFSDARLRPEQAVRAASGEYTIPVTPSILMGCTHGDHRREQAVQEALSASGFVIESNPDIEPALWEKFMLAAALGGVGLALGIPAGQVSNDEDGCKLLEQAMEEIAALAAHCGIALSQNAVSTTLAFAKTFPADATTSLQRDVEAGLPSEYDAIVGAVRRIATQRGGTSPLFELLEKLIAERLTRRAV